MAHRPRDSSGLLIIVVITTRSAQAGFPVMAVSPPGRYLQALRTITPCAGTSNRIAAAALT